MRSELVSEPGDPVRPNEDFASVGLSASGQGGSLVVLDGVTPPRDGYGCLHPVPWFSARLGGAPRGRATVRVVTWGAIAMAITAGIGALVGTVT